MKKITLSIIFFMTAQMLLFAAPRVTVYPKLLEKPGDSITVNWDDGAGGIYAPVSEIIYGTAPKNYTQSIGQSYSGGAVFTPSSLGMTGGVYYCRVSDTADGSWSAEFKLYIEKETAPVLISPANNEAVNSINPVFSWNPTAGVPFYTIAVFDSEIEIDLFGGSIEMTADPIWAANTDQTSIVYGTSDPLGYYDRITPPKLVPGNTYTWAVIHNYSGSPTILSEAYISMRTFTVTPVSAASPPSLISPANGVTITAQPVVLEWESSVNANSYEVHLMKSETAGNESFAGSGSVPVWSFETSSTSAAIPANIALGDAAYTWYVIAVDSTGKGASSVKRVFYNTESEAHVNVTLETMGPLGIKNVPRTMMYIETSSGGKVNLFPYTTDETGISFYLPPGDYNFTIRKEGYDTEVFSRSVIGTGDHNFTFTLSKSLYSITGRI
ncbi:MAG TPA: hypothetical protein ENN55_02915, partial [Firmicutes bacterium]|nr:hypothetical protein [Bacillota bacterium]